MAILDDLGQALGVLLTVEHLAHLFGGVLLGLIIGVLPGLGGIVGLSLLLPFLYGMDPTGALAMLIGLVAVVSTSDTFTSVMMGIPGSSGSQATIMDGFPLAKQGQAARALSAAFSASMIGGVCGAAVLTVLILVARPLILMFSSAELFMLTVLGLSMVGVLSGNNVAKGLASCGIGLLFGALGASPATGEFRMQFGIEYLADGIPLVVIGLAMFAVPEIVDLLRQDRAIARGAKLGHGWFTGIRDTWRNIGLVLRCSGIGAAIGALPGLGGSVVDWIAYGHVVQVARDKSRFGKGDIRGVLAPESANNAKEGGALVPTLLFGIPGSGAMAIFLGGMVLIALEPGPRMVEQQLDLTYVIVWSLALANVLGAGVCFLISGLVARLTTIRYALLAPFMVMVISFAAFQATRQIGDLIAMFAVGLFAILMKRFGWSRPAFLIGFVLSANSETYLYQAIQFYGFDFALRTGVLIIAALTVLSVWAGMRSVPTGQTDAKDQAESRATDLRPQMAFAALIAAIFVIGILDGLRHAFLAAVFPVAVGAVMILPVLWVFVTLARGKVASTANYDHEVQGEHAGRTDVTGLMHYIWWLGGFLAACMLVGFFIAIVLFFIVFLRVKANASWARIGVLTVCGVGLITSISWFMVLDFPGGLLQNHYYHYLPWPLR
jgi:putative tricarboxylic transport membrane protein